MHYLIGFLIGGVSCGSAAAIAMYLHYKQVNTAISKAQSEVNAAVNRAQSEAVTSLQSAHGKLDKILSILHVS